MQAPTRRHSDHGIGSCLMCSAASWDHVGLVASEKRCICITSLRAKQRTHSHRLKELVQDPYARGEILLFQ